MQIHSSIIFFHHIYPYTLHLHVVKKWKTSSADLIVSGKLWNGLDSADL